MSPWEVWREGGDGELGDAQSKTESRNETHKAIDHSTHSPLHDIHTSSLFHIDPPSSELPQLSGSISKRPSSFVQFSSFVV